MHNDVIADKDIVRRRGRNCRYVGAPNRVGDAEAGMQRARREAKAPDVDSQESVGGGAIAFHEASAANHALDERTFARDRDAI